jgi:hypothetical protein
MGYVLNDLIGQRFGRLVVTKRIPSKVYGIWRKRAWELICDCGNVTNSFTGQLTKGAKKSCGCLHKISSAENGRKSRHKVIKKESPCNSIYSHYKRDALKRGYEFNLDKYYFLKLLTSNCYYCDSEPNNVHEKNIHNFKYNGIDRIDNNVGYIIDNVVSCCKFCNVSKNNLTKEQFLNNIKKIYNHIIDK